MLPNESASHLIAQRQCASRGWTKPIWNLHDFKLYWYSV